MSRLVRLVRMAGVGARTGASVLLSKRSAATAERAAEVLGTLRGLPAKVGQMLSYVDGFLPESQRTAFEQAMQPLQRDAPTSSVDAVHALIEQELDAKLGDLFLEFRDEPIASASIGQVHWARLLDGREVAVKVQHARIDEAIESDLNNAGMLESVVSLLGPKAMNARAVLEVVRQRFREELDYTLEAERQRYFAEVHAGDSAIKIPRVIAERSSRRVLTTELARGASLAQAQGASVELRRQYAETLWRFVFKGYLVGGVFNADPHPGNYLFHPDGTVTFLDFGCVQPLEDTQLARARRVHHAALSGDAAGFERRIVELLELRGGKYQDVALDYTRQCFEPLFASPFHITRRYVAGLVQQIQELKQVMLARDKSFVPLPPHMVFMNRLQFGFYSVLARLDVEVDYRATELAFLGPG
ncbi:MAG TPA: AarF/ABC1/UbiB kinase family protein [Polyangiaceae bacterium]